ncbi:MAG: hypothetical protein F6K10_29025 [Moorea sp. SIO2B7]|nr:hypothetical protein [Moorena sp. SIO2B7]
MLTVVVSSSDAGKLKIVSNGDWGLGIGDWGLGIGGIQGARDWEIFNP